MVSTPNLAPPKRINSSHRPCAPDRGPSGAVAALRASACPRSRGSPETPVRNALLRCTHTRTPNRATTHTKPHPTAPPSLAAQLIAAPGSLPPALRSERPSPPAAGAGRGLRPRVMPPTFASRPKKPPPPPFLPLRSKPNTCTVLPCASVTRWVSTLNGRTGQRPSGPTRWPLCCAAPSKVNDDTGN